MTDRGSMSKRCMHDLPKSMCAECSHTRPVPKGMGEVHKTMAKFPGKCAGCGEQIVPGDRIAYSVDAETWVHEGCE